MILTDQDLAKVSRTLIELVRMCGNGEVRRDAAELALPPYVCRDGDLIESCFVALMLVVDGEIEARHIIGDGEIESVTDRARKGIVADGVC